MARTPPPWGHRRTPSRLLHGKRRNALISALHSEWSLPIPNGCGNPHRQPSAVKPPCEDTRVASPPFSLTIQTPRQRGLDCPRHYRPRTRPESLATSSRGTVAAGKKPVRAFVLPFHPVPPGQGTVLHCLAEVSVRAGPHPAANLPDSYLHAAPRVQPFNHLVISQAPGNHPGSCTPSRISDGLRLRTTVRRGTVIPIGHVARVTPRSTSYVSGSRPSVVSTSRYPALPADAGNGAGEMISAGRM